MSSTSYYFEETIQMLKEHFGRDSRFHYYEFVGNGACASTHRVQYREKPDGGVTDFLVKVARDGEEAKKSIKEERRWLRKVRGGEHIVSIVDFKSIPLRSPTFLKEWVALEWLPNGSLMKFIKRAVSLGATRVPNRFLWRIFLCLFRGCCGLHWPKSRCDGVRETEYPVPYTQPTGIAHHDLHAENVLFGDFAIAGEHGITPIAMMIDFGLTITHGDQYWKQALEENLDQVGKIMLSIIVMQNVQWLEDDDFVVFNHLGQDIETKATLLFPAGPGQPYPHPWLDEWLRVIIALCLVTEKDLHHLPTLDALNVWLLYAAVERTAAFYGDEVETDRSIRSFCETVIFTPPPS
ncbi:hypothetical protein F4805DRAFT_462630 [Annulohypoxylon moriforme]|nr:hypothetical protein F4805DRAFT_462630 [Annulohypoxylon moriforme]